MKNEQIKSDITEQNELVLTESKTLRDQHVYRDDILERVKTFSTLGEGSEVTLEMAANFYDVGFETIKSCIKRNRKEFNEYDELRILKGSILKEFKAQVQLAPEQSNIPSLTLLNRRGLLRIGMLLTESETAKTVRNYLLNLEEISTDEQKRWAIEREISKRERRLLTDAIKDFYEDIKNSGHEYAKFTNLVYEVIFGLNAQELKVMYEIERNTLLRDYFDTKDLNKIVKVERTISVLLSLEKNYDEIEAELIGMKDKFN